MDDEIILLSEKRIIEKQNFTIWPGDENFDSKTPIPSTSLSALREEKAILGYKIDDYRPRYGYYQNNPNKRGRSDDDKKDDEERRAKRPNMTNRYFSLDSVALINDTANSEKQKDARETEQFSQRRDFILKRLLQSRTLPEADPSQTDPKPEPTSQANLAEQKDSLPVKPSRKHEFQGEFIPLFDTGDTKVITTQQEDTGPNVWLKAYTGSYSTKCLTRVRNYLLESLKPTTDSSYTDRSGEIAKMKCSIKSKFDDDARLWKRIKRDTQIAKQEVLDKHDLYRRHEARMSMKTPTKIQFIELDESDSEASSNEEDVIKMINKQNTNINFDDDERSILSEDLVSDENDDDSDKDSKCAQFGKYSKKNQDSKKSENKVKKNVKCLSEQKQKQKHKKIKKIKKNEEERLLFESIGNNNDRLSSKKNVEDRSGDELENLKLEYKKLRNSRNRTLRSIKKRIKDGKTHDLDYEVEREMLNNEMIKLRRMIKKLNRKKRPAPTPMQTRSSNDSFHELVLNSSFNSNLSPDSSPDSSPESPQIDRLSNYENKMRNSKKKNKRDQNKKNKQDKSNNNVNKSKNKNKPSEVKLVKNNKSKLKTKKFNGLRKKSKKQNLIQL